MDDDTKKALLLAGAAAAAAAALTALGVVLVRRARSGSTSLTPEATSSMGIVQTVGKHWILSNKVAQSGMAANYGWHFNGATFEGMKFEPTVSLPGVRVIQGVGTKHNRFHSDYSQTCVLASQTCTYQGQERVLSELLTDPDASSLISVEGPLLITRQPGVDRLDPISVSPQPGGISRADVAALPDDIPQREAILLSWVEQGLAEYTWSDVTTGDLTFHIFSDALMFGGVRVNVSATLEQQIADRLACSLLTARMADLAFEQAATVLHPFPLPATSQMSSTAYMLDESDKVAGAIG